MVDTEFIRLKDIATACGVSPMFFANKKNKPMYFPELVELMPGVTAYRKTDADVFIAQWKLDEQRKTEELKASQNIPAPAQNLESLVKLLQSAEDRARKLEESNHSLRAEIVKGTQDLAWFTTLKEACKDLVADSDKTNSQAFLTHRMNIRRILQWDGK